MKSSETNSLCEEYKQADDKLRHAINQYRSMMKEIRKELHQEWNKGQASYQNYHMHLQNCLVN